MDIKRIPILSLSSIISLTDILGELPLPSAHPDSINQSLWYNTDVYNEAIKVLNSNNQHAFESLTKALSSVSTDDLEFKDTSDEKGGLNDMPPIFAKMVNNDPECFRSKIGFEDFFVIKEVVNDESEVKPKENNDKTKKKKKKHKESNESKSNKNFVSQADSNSYAIASRHNGLRLTIRKLSDNSGAATSFKMAEIIEPVKEQVKIEEVHTNKEQLNNTKIINSSTTSESTNQSSLDISEKSLKTEEKTEPKLVTTNNQSNNSTVNIEKNYFINIATLDSQTNFFDDEKIFDTDVANLDTQNPVDDFHDRRSLKSNPNSNSLSVHELQINETVKDPIMELESRNSSQHEDNQSTQQHFGLAAYLTKPSSTNNTSNNNNSSVASHGGSNYINSVGHPNHEHQPGSCLSVGPNSVEYSELKTSDASIHDSTPAQPNGPNSALSFENEQIALGDKIRKSRGRNKELENLMKWQIKDKGVPKNDPLDCTNVGPGERVKKRTRKCVKRTEREDGSSISENSYQTNDVSPHIPDLAQNHLSLKSESSIDDEIKQSPLISNYNPLSVSHDKSHSNVPQVFSPSNSDYINCYPLPSKQDCLNAQITSSIVDSFNTEVNQASLEINSNLALSTTTADDSHSQDFSVNTGIVKSKKNPSKNRIRISSRTSSLENYGSFDLNYSSLKPDNIDDLSDNSSGILDTKVKSKNKANTKNNKKKKAKKVTSMKGTSTTNSKLQHIFASREVYVTNRQRIFRSSEYYSNMNPVILLTPLREDDYNNVPSPNSSVSSTSTIPFTFENEASLANATGLLAGSDSHNQHESNSQRRYCESLKFKFSNFLDSLLKNVEELDLYHIASMNKAQCNVENFGTIDESASLSPEVLHRLNSFVGKMKEYSIMNDVPVGKLVRLLMLLLVNMSSSRTLTEGKKRVQRQLQQLINCLDASLIALSIMVSPDMPRAIFLEDVIECATDLFRTILRFIIYPMYDSTYSRQSCSNDILLTAISNITVNKSFSNSENAVKLTNRVQCGVNCLSELLIQKPNRLTDEAVLKITSLAMSALTVANVANIQMSMIPLMSGVFSQYEGHRKSIITDVLYTLTHIPVSGGNAKKNYKKYKINSEESIQVISASILILFQSVVQKSSCNKKTNNNKSSTSADNAENAVMSTLTSAVKMMQIFVHTFFKKACLKGEESYKFALDRFLQDLFLTFNKPEWPAANFLLHTFGDIILCHLNSNQTNRPVAIDLLGNICAFVNKEISKFKSKSQSILIDDAIMSLCRNNRITEDKLIKIESLANEEKLRLLKLVLINFLNLDSTDATCMYSRRHTVGLLLQELVNSGKESALNNKPEEVYKSVLMGQLSATPSSSLNTFELIEVSYEDACQICRIINLTRDMQNFEKYLTKICLCLDENSIPVRTKSIKSLTMVLEEDASILTKGVIEKAINKRFLDSSIAVREATVELVGKFLLKKPELINQYYPVLITRIADTGTSVRKRVIKVLWDICSANPDFPNAADAYSKIMRRFFDEDSVRKLVNEVFKNIWFTPINDRDPVKLQQRIFSIANVIQCLGQDEKYNHKLMLQFITQLSKTEFEQSSDVKAQKNFEKSLQQIIETLHQTVIRLQEVSSNSSDMGQSRYHQGKQDENSKCKSVNQNQKKLCSTWDALHIFTQVRPKLIWPYLANLSSLLRQIRPSYTQSNSSGSGSNSNNNSGSNSNCGSNNGSSSLKQMLSINHDMATCMNHLCGILDAGLAAAHGYSLEHKGINLSHDNLCEIVEDLVNLAVNAPKRFIVDSAVKCLCRVTSFTKKYATVQNLFARSYLKAINLSDQLKGILQMNPPSNISQQCNVLFRMTYNSVVLCRYFDMTDLLNKDLAPLAKHVFTNLLDITMYFAINFPRISDIKERFIVNMNHLVHKDGNQLISGPIYEFYVSTLNLIHSEIPLSNESCNAITYVLENISDYLKHNELRMLEENSNWKYKSQQESLKELSDLSDSFGNIVSQKYLGLVLDCCLFYRPEVRITALNFVCKILSQGLVQPITCLPHLIALQGDTDSKTKFKADSQLSELNNKYPAYLPIKAMAGIRLSYQLQKSIANSKLTDPSLKLEIDPNTGQKRLKPIRGWVSANDLNSRTNSAIISSSIGSVDATSGGGGGGSSSASPVTFQAINHQLYDLLRKSRQNWRAFLSGIVGLFDSAGQLDIEESIFLTDQLASFYYQVQEEPIFLVYKLDLLIGVTGQTVLRECRDVFKQASRSLADRAYKEGELTSNEISILTKILFNCVDTSPSTIERLRLAIEVGGRRILLLLSLHDYLIQTYNLSESKIASYHQMQQATSAVANNAASKYWDKPICRSINAIPFKVPPKCLLLPNTGVNEFFIQELIQEFLQLRECLLHNNNNNNNIGDANSNNNNNNNSSNNNNNNSNNNNSSSNNISNNNDNSIQNSTNNNNNNSNSGNVNISQHCYIDNRSNTSNNNNSNNNNNGMLNNSKVATPNTFNNVEREQLGLLRSTGNTPTKASGASNSGAKVSNNNNSITRQHQQSHQTYSQDTREQSQQQQYQQEYGNRHSNSAPYSLTKSSSLGNGNIPHKKPGRMKRESMSTKSPTPKPVRVEVTTTNSESEEGESSYFHIKKGAVNKNCNSNSGGGGGGVGGGGSCVSVSVSNTVGVKRRSVSPIGVVGGTTTGLSPASMSSSSTIAEQPPVAKKKRLISSSSSSSRQLQQQQHQHQHQTQNSDSPVTTTNHHHHHHNNHHHHSRQNQRRYHIADKKIPSLTKSSSAKDINLEEKKQRKSMDSDLIKTKNGIPELHLKHSSTNKKPTSTNKSTNKAAPRLTLTNLPSDFLGVSSHTGNSNTNNSNTNVGLVGSNNSSANNKIKPSSNHSTDKSFKLSSSSLSGYNNNNNNKIERDKSQTSLHSNNSNSSSRVFRGSSLSNSRHSEQQHHHHQQQHHQHQHQHQQQQHHHHHHNSSSNYQSNNTPKKHLFKTSNKTMPDLSRGNSGGGGGGPGGSTSSNNKKRLTSPVRVKKVKKRKRVISTSSESEDADDDDDDDDDWD